MNINFKKDISEDLKNLVEEEQIKYEKLNNVCCNYEPFYIVAKEQETVLGVLHGYTCYAEVYVDDIVVFLKYRNKGIGKAMLKAVQDKFSNGLYNNINLVTNSFQAPKFYEKCGFALEFIRHNEKNPSLTKYLSVKIKQEI